MIRLATTPESGPRRADYCTSSIRVPRSSLARLSVGEISYRIVPLPVQIEKNKDVITQSGEQARFKLCGQTFIVVEDPDSGSKSSLEGRDILALLTERELQIAVLVAHGNPVKRVANRLGITDWTVKEHLRRIFGKLGVRNQAAMVFRCAELIQHLDRDGVR